uniref:Uncharacterized protein n=1 Tax=Romanomermis culicivorax TaxID=13658 RepID=A0A915IE68_ROMCU
MYKLVKNLENITLDEDYVHREILKDITSHEEELVADEDLEGDTYVLCNVLECQFKFDKELLGYCRSD